MHSSARQQVDSIPNPRHKLQVMIEIFGKWRSVFAGWQLGTRAEDDPECRAVRDQRELLLSMRAELNALIQLLIREKVFSYNDWCKQMCEEIDILDKAYEERFPGFQVSAMGLVITDKEKAAETTKGWRP